MSNSIDKITINNPLLDSRWKVLPCQKEMIPKWVMQGQKIKDIAFKLGVSYHTIYYILHPEKLEDFIEESLRYYTPVGRFLRRANKDVEIAGKTIPKDTFVIVMPGAANTDPEKF